LTVTVVLQILSLKLI